MKISGNKLFWAFSQNKLIGLFLLLIVGSCSTYSDKKEYVDVEGFTYYKIKKFVDGDTYWLEDGSPDGVKVRLIGINAPEPRNYFKMKEQPFGKEASAHIKKLIGDSKVRVELDVQELDQYGRLLAYCYLEDGRMINEEMVKAGFAQVATYPPNIVYEKIFYEAQVYARKNKFGMWHDDLSK